MSNETKWTPGRWRLAMDCGDQVAVFADNPEHPLICTVSKGSHRPHGDANAALLLAAPDLYAALESAEFRLRSAGNMLSAICESDPTRDRREAANRAIAAANVCAVALRRARGEDVP